MGDKRPAGLVVWEAKRKKQKVGTRVASGCSIYGIEFFSLIAVTQSLVLDGSELLQSQSFAHMHYFRPDSLGPGPLSFAGIALVLSPEASRHLPRSLLIQEAPMGRSPPLPLSST